MLKFKDSKGAEWDISLHVGNLIKVCDLLGITLGQLQGLAENGIGGFDQLHLSTVLELIPIICEEQMNERHVTKDVFVKSIGIPELKGLFSVLMEAVAVTSPEPTKDKGAEGGQNGPLDTGSQETSTS